MLVFEETLSGRADIPIFATDVNHQPIPLHRVTLIQPFVQFLERFGTPVERAFSRAGLAYNALEDTNNYLPSHGFWQFLADTSDKEGIRDLGLRVGQAFGADIGDPHMRELFLQSPTLYRGLVNASALLNRTVSNMRLGLLQRPNSDFTLYTFLPSCSRNNPAIEQISWYGITTLIAQVRVYAGRWWAPTEIGVMITDAPCRSFRETYPQSRLRSGQPYNYIALENSLLTLPPIRDRAAPETSASLHYAPVPDDLATSLRQVLVSYAETGDLSLRFAAELCQMSERTLQRKLADKGTNFAELLNEARFAAATRLLNNKALKITDVAYRLGYSDVAHFSRAFRRMAGVTPRAYRRQQ